MKLIKKLTAFTLAAIVCVSFCVMSFPVSAIHTLFNGPTTDVNFFDLETGNLSYGRVHITYWAIPENYTDLEVETYAKNIHFGTENPFILMRASASVALIFDDYYTRSGESYDECDAWDYGISTYVYGIDLIDEDHYIIGFTSHHSMYTVDITDGRGELSVVEQYGPDIYISTSS